MLLSVVLLGALMFGMYYVEHGTLDITQPIVNQYITQ